MANLTQFTLDIAERGLTLAQEMQGHAYTVGDFENVQYWQGKVRYYESLIQEIQSEREAA